MFGKVNDWDKVKQSLYKKVKRFAVIDFLDVDKLLGTGKKKIYIYYENYLIGERDYNEAEVKWLKKFMPVVDRTKGRPYPVEYEKIPPKVAILGRLNLLDLNLPE